MTTPQKLLCLFLALLAATLAASCTTSSRTETAPVQQAWTQPDLEQAVETWRIQSGVPGVVAGISFPHRSEILIARGESNKQDH
jgi:acyl-homoserine lactone acylase PvdQ